MKYSILTIKWGSEFSSEHVNILHIVQGRKRYELFGLSVHLYDR